MHNRGEVLIFEKNVFDWCDRIWAFGDIVARTHSYKYAFDGRGLSLRDEKDLFVSARGSAKCFAVCRIYHFDGISGGTDSEQTFLFKSLGLFKRKGQYFRANLSQILGGVVCAIFADCILFSGQKQAYLFECQRTAEKYK